MKYLAGYVNIWRILRGTPLRPSDSKFESLMFQYHGHVTMFGNNVQLKIAMYARNLSRVINQLDEFIR